MIVECPGCKGRYDITGRPPNTTAKCRCGTTFTLPNPSAFAGSLSCPGCGGKVSPQLKACTYCQTELLLKACPSCFKRIFHGSKHCDECGAKVTVPARATKEGKAALFTCPRCGPPSHLDARLVGDVLLDECATCHGIWLDHIALDALIKKREDVSTENALGISQQATLPPTVVGVGEKMYLRCPECDNLMNRVNFSKRSGILIDVCRAHGTWFDENELAAVIHFVKKGGLVHSKKAELTELSHQQKRDTSAAPKPLVLSGPRRTPEGDLFTLFCESIGTVASYLFSLLKY